MLSMLLLLVAAPQSVGPAMPPAPPSAPRGVAMPVLGDGGYGCESDVRRAADPMARGALMWREGDAPVAHYRLLDRRVNGCPAPVIVNYRVPGSNALGREVGPAPRR